MKSDLELNQETLRMIADSFTGENTKIYELAKQFMKLKFGDFIVKETLIETYLEDFIQFKIPVVNYLEVFDSPSMVKLKEETGVMEVEFQYCDVSCTSADYSSKFCIFFENKLMLDEWL